MVSRMMVTWMCWGMGFQSVIRVTAKGRKQKKEKMLILHIGATLWRHVQERVHWGQGNLGCFLLDQGGQERDQSVFSCSLSLKRSNLVQYTLLMICGLRRKSGRPPYGIFERAREEGWIRQIRQGEYTVLLNNSELTGSFWECDR